MGTEDPSAASPTAAPAPAFVSRCAPSTPITRALRETPGVASGPNQQSASSTWPCQEIHCVSVPAGRATCSMPGPSLTPTGPKPLVGSAPPSARSARRRAIRTTVDNGGEYSSGSCRRRAGPRTVRRAGSIQTPSTRSRSKASASRSSAADPGNADRFMVATATVTGSRSTAITSSPSAEAAIASPPMPQPRSAIVATPASRKRRACSAAIGRRVACSSPRGVSSIRSANSPNFSRPLARSRDWVSTAETSSGSCPAARSVAPSFRASASTYGGRVCSRSQPSGTSTRSRPAAKAVSAGSVDAGSEYAGEPDGADC